MTGNGHATGNGIRVTATGHAGPRDGQMNASAPDCPGSSQKTATGTTETAHGQKGSVTSHGESAFVHETANGPWNESATREPGHATPETVNGHSDAHHENLDLLREKTVSGSGPWQTPQFRESVTDDHVLQRQKRLLGKGQRAQATPESTMIALLQPP